MNGMDLGGMEEECRVLLESKECRLPKNVEFGEAQIVMLCGLR